MGAGRGTFAPNGITFSVPLSATGSTGGAGAQRQPGHADLAAVEAAVGGAGALGVDAEQLAPLQQRGGLLQHGLRGVRALAVDRQAAAQTHEKKPETGLPEKYSFLAVNVTCRGSSAGSRNESSTDRWLAARIAGPVRGTWAAPEMCGRHIAWTSGVEANLATW
ncbi:hypothetical protein GCM10020001_004270 [Nonomuraea salmonea]